MYFSTQIINVCQNAFLQDLTLINDPLIKSALNAIYHTFCVIWYLKAYCDVCPI